MTGERWGEVMRAQALLPAHTAPELLLGGIFFLFLAADVSPQKLWFVGDGGRPGEVMRAQPHLPVHTAHELWLRGIFFLFLAALPPQKP